MSVPTIQDDTLAGEPIVERISSNIVQTLRQMTTANGSYANAQVLRPSPARPDPIVNYRLTIVEADPEEHEGGDTSEGPVRDGYEAPDGVTVWVQPYFIECVVVLPEDSTTPVARCINRVRSDVERELLKDTKRGGLAWHTKIRAPQMYEIAENGREGRILVLAEVIYRTLTDDPYKLPGE